MSIAHMGRGGTKYNCLSVPLNVWLPRLQVPMSCPSQTDLHIVEPIIVFHQKLMVFIASCVHHCLDNYGTSGAALARPRVDGVR